MFNGRKVEHRQPERVISGVKLTTVVFDPQAGRFRQFQRATDVEIYPQHGDTPRIYELGIPVDDAPWELPFDINVLQKTPLDTERDMLPQKYKASLIAQLIGPMSDQYVTYMEEQQSAPPELKDDLANAENLTPEAQAVLVKTVTAAEREQVVRRNPLDKDDLSESQELESHGFLPLNRGALPAGVSGLLRANPTVAAKHDEVCKPHFGVDKNFPPETERQRKCMAVFVEIASTLVGKPVRCDRIRGPGATAAWSNGRLSLNIDVDYLWDDPLGEKALGVILHECAHDRVSGHAVDFADEVARLGGTLAAIVGENPGWWSQLHNKVVDKASGELASR
jgi:hypothetical protein